MDIDTIHHHDVTTLMEGEVKFDSSSRHPYLVVFVGQNSGNRYKIKKGATTLGRSPEADITLDDQMISRIHCTVEWKGDKISIEDKGSTNSTYVDSKKVNRADLRRGAPLQIGQSVMKVEFKDKAEIRLEDSLIKSASVDALTGTFNRQFFMKRAAEEIAFARRHEKAVGFIMMDIDHFKQVNDTYGHQMGDSVLHQFATIVSQVKRTEDVFARYGGEEFIIMPRGELHKNGLSLQCERIRKAVEKFEFHFGEDQVRITVSVGYSLKEADSTAELSLTQLISEADKALYLAKKRGRNRTETIL
jgi:two-component system cell cycle response regulator